MISFSIAPPLVRIFLVMVSPILCLQNRTTSSDGSGSLPKARLVIQYSFYHNKKMTRYDECTESGTANLCVLCVVVSAPIALSYNITLINLTSAGVIGSHMPVCASCLPFRTWIHGTGAFRSISSHSRDNISIILMDVSC